MSIRAAALALAIILSSTLPAVASTACDLITVSEASAAMHVQSLPGKARTGRRGTSCRYYSPDHKMNVFVQTLQAGDMLGAAQLGGKPVAGVGDKALWTAASLFVQKGGKYAQVALYTSPSSMQQMEPGVVTLGKLMAGRM
jgi:hypothetical protein